MAKPFDATTKFLMGIEPAAWLRLAGLLAPDQPVPPITLIDTDLSTITSSIDQVFQVDGSNPSLDHFELQASYERGMDERIHWYNGLIRYEFRQTVRSVVILLRPQADGPLLKGRVFFDDGVFHLDFRYKIIRLWQVPTEDLLNGGLATLPLAPLTVSSEVQAADIIGKMKGRIDRETDAPLSPEIT